jgi:hypothetical protein
MKTGILILLAIAAVILNNCGVEQTTFLKYIGGAGIDRGVTVEQVSDDGYLVTGYTTRRAAGGEDVLLVRTDSSGDTIWTKAIGGKDKDNGWAVRKNADGGYIIVGFTASFGAGGMDIYLIRTDEAGDTLWTKTFGGEGDEFGWDIRRTADDGFIIAAQTSSFGEGEIDAYLIKTDSDGDEKWSKSYGGEKIDRIFSVRQTPDGGYVAGGITYSFGEGDRDAYLLKSDASGEMEWYKNFGGTVYDVGHSVALTDGDGYLITDYGESFATYGKRDVYLIKTDAGGQMQWMKTFGGSENDRAMKGQQTKDGGYIAVGFTQISGESGWDWDVFLIKTDMVGDTLWTRTFGDRDTHDFGYTVQATNDGGYILTGQKQSFDGDESEVLLIKTDSEGRVNP